MSKASGNTQQPASGDLLPKNLPRAVFKNTVALIIGNLCITGMKYVVYVLIFRFLGSERFGEYSLLLTLLAYGEVILDFGLGEIFARDLIRTPGRKAELLSTMAGLKLLQALAAFTVLVMILLGLGYPTHMIIAGLIGGVEFFFFAGILFYRGIFKAAMVNGRGVAAELPSSLLFTGLVALACIKGQGLILIFIGVTAGRILYLLLLHRSGGDIVGPFTLQWNGPAMKRYFLDAFPLGLTTVLVGIYMNVDQLMLSKLDGFRAVGLYSAAYRFVLPLVAVPAALMSALYPIFCSYWLTQMDAFRKIFQWGVNCAILIGGGILCGMTASAEFLMGLFGPEAAEAAGALRVLGGAIAAMALSTVFGPMFLVTRRLWLSSFLGVIGAVVNIGLNLYLIPHYSYMGSAIATLLTELVVLIPAIIVLQRIMGCRLSWRVLPLAGLSAALSILAVQWSGFMGTQWGGLLAVLTFSGLCLLTGALKTDEIKTLITHLRGNK